MLPTTLMVYLSNRCDMACRYCYVAVNQGEARYLCADQVRSAMDRFMELPGGGPRKIFFLGGEPLLRWSVLRSCVVYGRKRYGPSLQYQVYTNGLALTPNKLDFMLAHDMTVILSLDGEKKANDENRILYGQEGSAFDAAARRLSRLPKGRLGVNLVFTTNTLGSLLSNIGYFQREGFGSISFTPDVNEFWPDARIAALSAVMEDFRRYYHALVMGGGRPFEILNLYALLRQARQEAGQYWWRECQNLVMGGDGHFYACDKALSFPFDKAAGSTIGSLEAGVDWEKRAGFFNEARSFIAAHAEDPGSFTSCPMGVFLTQKVLGRDPAKALSNFELVSRAYGRPLLGLARDLWEHPLFRSLHHIARFSEV